MADETQGLAVGIAELGRENSGIRRYGEVLAGGLRGMPGVEVTEVSVALTSPGWRGIRDAGRLVRTLRHVDVAVLPYTRWNIWSPSVTRLVQLALVHLGLRRRTLTVLHDVNHPGSPRSREWWALALTVRLSGATVIHSEHERTELGAIPGARGVELIHHFVVERQDHARAAARAELGVSDSKVVVGMIGWINPRKNCELAIEALALSEPAVELWLVGGAGIGQEAHVKSLRALARERGVEDRLVITGTIPEAELEQRLAALDVGLCPYRRISASGSLSTLLGAHRPVIVTDVDFARDLRAVAPEVVHTLPALDAPTIARAITEVVAHPPERAAYEPILRERSVAVTASRYHGLLTTAAG